MKRFWSKVKKSDGCWNWIACRNRQGYGQFGLSKGGYVLAHRFSYELANGSIPTGLCILHQCHNPSCVRPDHLKAGTRIENNQDMVECGRSLVGERNTQSKLTDQDIREIRRKFEDGETQATISADFSVSTSTIGRVVLRQLWSHVD